MTEPDPEQWVLLECDDGNSPDCLVRSDSVWYKDVEALGWLHFGADLWACPECIEWDANENKF